MRCKVIDCDKPVEKVADKSAESVSYHTKYAHIVLFPSKEAEHGRCYYHQRIHEAEVITAERREEIERKAKEQRRYTLQLLKLTSNQRDRSLL